MMQEAQMVAIPYGLAQRMIRVLAMHDAALCFDRMMSEWEGMAGRKRSKEDASTEVRRVSDDLCQFMSRAALYHRGGINAFLPLYDKILVDEGGEKAARIAAAVAELERVMREAGTSR